MKIILTGEPHVGKSTLLKDLVTDIENKQGFITNEMINDQTRTGFELVAANGSRQVLASVDSDSKVRVSKYGVNIDNLNKFIEDLPDVKVDDLLYIDEVGQMQLYSDAFRNLVKHYLSLQNHFIGTLSSVYHDDFINELSTRDDIQIVHLTLDNRDTVRNELKAKYQ